MFLIIFCSSILEYLIFLQLLYLMNINLIKRDSFSSFSEQIYLDEKLDIINLVCFLKSKLYKLIIFLKVILQIFNDF